MRSTYLFVCPPPPPPAKNVFSHPSIAPPVPHGIAKAPHHGSAAEALAHQIAVCGREFTRAGREKGDPARLIVEERTKHDFEWAMIRKMSFPLTNREFLGRYLCFQEPSGDLVVVFEALPDSTKVDYGANLKVVRGKSTGITRFKSINNGTQCEVTLVNHLDAGGFIPERIAVAKIPLALGSVIKMRGKFQRDDAVDKMGRDELVSVIDREAQVYDEKEESVVEGAHKKLSVLKEEDFKELGSPDHLVKMQYILKEGSSTGIGRATTVRYERSERKKGYGRAAQ
jgi:hypothetical protein